MPIQKKQQNQKPNNEKKATKDAVTEDVIYNGEVPHFDETINVDIRNRKEQFFSGVAKTVSSLNDTGEFDVLPQHANFVTLIKGYVIIDKKLPTEKKFEIENGVLAAKTGAVDVYLDF